MFILVRHAIAGLLDLFDSADLERAALCTHGETFAELSRVWGERWPGLVDAPELAQTPKGGSWVIENYNTSAASARFVRPPLSNGS